GVQYDRPPLSTMIRMGINLSKSGEAPETKQKIDKALGVELTPDTAYIFAPIEVLENALTSREAEWSTREVATTERKQDQDRFDSGILQTGMLPAETDLKEAKQYNELLQKVMRAAPKGIEKTIWGRVVRFGTFRENGKGETFFCVAPKHAAA